MNKVTRSLVIQENHVAFVLESFSWIFSGWPIIKWKKNFGVFQGFFCAKSKVVPGDLSKIGGANVNKKAEYMQCYCSIKYR